MFKDRVCLVTGGASGIGAELVKAYSKQGAKVIALDRTGTTPQDENIEYISCNVTDRPKMRETIDSVFQKHKRIDVVVAAAGIHQSIPFTEMLDDDFDRMIQIQLTGVYNTVKPIIPYMVEQRYGRIITISSVAGLAGAGVEPAAHYAAAKGGVIALTKSLAREYGPYGIVANSIAPGLIETPLTSNFQETGKKAYAQNVPVRRIGQPEDLVGTALLLSGEQSSFINGQVISVCGGYLMR